MKLANPFSSVTDEQLAEVVRRLAAALCPRAIYLFGSQARGVPRPGGDIDLMVIVDGEPSRLDLYRMGSAAIRELRLPVELHFSSGERFDRFADVFGSFQHEIRRKGILLYAAEN